MVEQKISLFDLAELENGEMVNLEEIYNKKDDGLNLLGEEIGDFLLRKKIKKANNVTPTLFSNNCNSDLKNKIDRVLQTSNLKEEIAKKRAKHDFDMKMARVKRIKSKVYRRMLRKKAKQGKEQLDDFNSNEGVEIENLEDIMPEIAQNNSSENLEGFDPVITFQNETKIVKKIDIKPEEKKEINLMFDSSEDQQNEKEFLEEKFKIVKEEAPAIVEHVLPGWGDWGGEDLITTKNRANTIIEKKEGVRNVDRTDYNKSNVIIGQKVTVPEKYLSNLPYGYNSEEYKTTIKTLISPEVTSSRVFSKIIKREEDGTFGKNIEPNEYNPEY